MEYYKFFFIALLIGVSVAFYYIIYPFFLAVVFALILAHFFKKPYNYFLSKTSERVASVLSIALAIFSFIIPFLLITILLASEARKGYDQVQTIIGKNLNEIQTDITNVAMLQILDNNPELLKEVGAFFFDDQEVTSIQDLTRHFFGYIKDLFSFLFKELQGLVVNITTILLNFLIMVYLLYFFFKEGDNVLEQIKNFIPMERGETDELINEAFRIIDATVIGTIIVGTAEGFYGGIIFSILGIPSPVTWGVLMAIASMFPILGTNGFLIPVGLYQLFIGNYWGAVLILVIGVGGIMISQNIIKPKLVGDRSGLHPALIVLSTLGGIYAIGISGFLVGPTIATIFVVFWKLFRQKSVLETIAPKSSKSISKN